MRALLAVAALAATCNTTPTPGGSGGSPSPDGGGSCDAAVRNLEELGCPYPNGWAASCPGRPGAVVDCLATAKTCLDSRACGGYP